MTTLTLAEARRVFDGRIAVMGRRNDAVVSGSEKDSEETAPSFGELTRSRSLAVNPAHFFLRRGK